MNILAIETATAYCSVALETPQGLISRFESTNRLHAQKLLPMIDELLYEANLSLPQINAIAISIGPGSFTGLRIGAGVVQGLAFAHQIPVIPVSTLATIAQGVVRLLNLKDARVHVLLDAHMKEYFYGEYQEKDGLVEAVQEDQLIKPLTLTLFPKERGGKEEIPLLPGGRGDEEEISLFPKGRGNEKSISLSHDLGEGQGEGCYLLTDCHIDISNQSIKTIKLQDLQLPAAIDVITLAKQSTEKIDAIHLQPVYLRTEDAWKKQG